MEEGKRIWKQHIVSGGLGLVVGPLLIWQIDYAVFAFVRAPANSEPPKSCQVGGINPLVCSFRPEAPLIFRLFYISVSLTTQLNC
jgi:hypothetical protein